MDCTIFTFCILDSLTVCSSRLIGVARLLTPGYYLYIPHVDFPGRGGAVGPVPALPTGRTAHRAGTPTLCMEPAGSTAHRAIAD